MGAVREAFDFVYRDWVIAGIPASGANEPAKSEIRSLGSTIEQLLATSGISSTIYETAAAGVAATTNGQLFLVKGDGVNSFADLYKNVAGAAVNQGVSLASAAAVEALFAIAKSAADAAQLTADDALTAADQVGARVDGVEERFDAAFVQAEPKSVIPLFAQKSTGKVPAWLKNGLFEPYGFTPKARDKAVADVVSRVEVTRDIRPLMHSAGRVFMWLKNGLFDVKGVTEEFQVKATAIVTRKAGNAKRYRPLAEVDGKVAAWIDPSGLFGAKGLASSLISSIRTSFSGIFAPQVSNRSVPLATDGATLGHFNALLGTLRAGGSVQIPIGINGDSWSEQLAITQGLQAVMAKEFPVLQAPGFMQVREGGFINGATRTVSSGAQAWNEVDGSNVSVFPYGAGPDGKNIWTDGADRWITFSNVVAKTLEIYYRNHGGTFRYRVDTGAWTTVVCANDASFGLVSITGLPEVAHTLEIDTTGNTGIVSLVGAAGLTDSPGIIFHRWGNGGTTGFRINQYVPQYAAPILARLGIVLNFTVLGTNDYRVSNSPPSEYALAFQNVMAAVRTAVPDAAVVAMVPPRSGGVTVTPLSAYRDAAHAWAVASGGEMLNLYDQLPDYPVSLGYGIWSDFLHLNGNGGSWTADAANTFFLKVRR